MVRETLCVCGLVYGCAYRFVYVILCERKFLGKSLVHVHGEFLVYHHPEWIYHHT